MEKLYVLYDSKCELCERLKDWILVQRSWLGISVMAAGSEKARKMFPDLEKLATANDLVVVSDKGQVYLNDRAWIMVFYALEEYRDWSYRLAHPLLMPLARQAYAAISRNRYAISRWLRGGRPEDLARELRSVPLEACAAPQAPAKINISDYLR
ncbi:MAG TPA: DCC1-like thiol-disulfide oxidoreductase family protein [Candidatus Angelobacter sp.]|nr:DCC1-like thiol-disulfide oxidoreductase family protein [Candidatus Angelobacter sp.]